MNIRGIPAGLESGFMVDIVTSALSKYDTSLTTDVI